MKGCACQGLKKELTTYTNIYIQTSTKDLFENMVYSLKILLITEISESDVKTALFWTITHHAVVIPYRRSGTVQQKSIGQKFSKSRTGSDVRYSCHHNLSRFTFPIFAHSCRFSVSHSLQSITRRVYEPKTTVHLINFKLKH